MHTSHCALWRKTYIFESKKNLSIYISHPFLAVVLKWDPAIKQHGVQQLRVLQLIISAACCYDSQHMQLPSGARKAEQLKPHFSTLYVRSINWVFCVCVSVDSHGQRAGQGRVFHPLMSYFNGLNLHCLFFPKKEKYKAISVFHFWNLAH